jgi:hypothetical protein
VQRECADILKCPPRVVDAGGRRLGHLVRRCLPLHAGTESLRTHRWRKEDSNSRFNDKEPATK